MEDNLLFEAYTLKKEIDEKTKKLRAINKMVEADTVFNEKKTGYRIGSGVKAKVTLRNNVKYDQAKVGALKEHFNFFSEVFKPEYKPQTSKIDAYASTHPDFAKAIDWSREIKPGAPTVTYELLDEVPNA